jgi:hypothetical protein
VTLVHAETGEIVAQLDPDEARSLTESIKASASRLYHLVVQAHEGQAHRALGYATWAEYWQAEFDMSRSYAYRILDQAKVIGELTAAAGMSPDGDTSPMGDITEAAARDIKPRLGEVAGAVAERVAAEKNPTDETKRRIVVEEVQKHRSPVASFNPGRGEVPEDEPGRDLDEDLEDPPEHAGDEGEGEPPSPSPVPSNEAIEAYLDDLPEQKRLALRNSVLTAKKALGTVVADLDPEVAADLVEPADRQYEVNTISRHIVWLNDYVRALKRSGLTVMKGGRG